MLGNKKEEGKMEDLVRKAKDDPVFKKVIGKANKPKIKVKKTRKRVKKVKSRHIPGLDVLGFAPSPEAKKILRGIEEYIDFDDKSGLVNDTVSDFTQSGEEYETALLAVAYFANGEKWKGLDLIKRIDAHRDAQELSRHSYFYAHAAAAVALAYLAAERKDDALEIIKDIERGEFDHETGLFKGYDTLADNIPVIRTIDNALLATAYIAAGKRGHGLTLIRNIKKHIGFDSDKPRLFKNKLNDPSSAIVPENAAVTLAYFAAGMPGAGLRLFKDMNTIFHLDETIKENDLFSYRTFQKNKRIHSEDNILLAIAYMAKEYFENNQ